MKPTFINEVKLWWHCLINFHRRFCHSSILDTTIKQGICCSDCSYGETEKLKNAKEYLFPGYKLGGE